MEFKAWPKITRVENRRPPQFTEKIDGTNACIVISHSNPDENTIATYEENGVTTSIWAQSRNRFIIPANDNFGFAKWVSDHCDELVILGEGHYFGEWWGSGIGRTYGLTEKRFSPFNVHRWNAYNPIPHLVQPVPVLPVRTVEEAREFLKTNGSVAVPGWMRPEGAVMYDIDADCNFKIIIDK